ncbi:MAG: hypothetical protein D6744_09160 [Planctomycetota bacterium]|nr:MAG: hypothetical protein D6744_09160 [Planctomycetota bacterium]
MKRLRLLSAWWAATIVAAAAHADPSYERLLRHVPADTATVVVIPSIDALVEGVLAFAREAGIPDVRIASEDIVEELGLRDALIDASIIETDGPLLIVTQAEAVAPIVIVGLKPTKAKAALETAKIVDRALIAAGSTEQLDAAVAGSTTRAKTIAEALGSLDDLRAALYVDREALATAIDDAFMSIEGVLAMIAVNPQVQGAMPVLRVVIDGFRDLIDDTAALIVRGTIGADGVTLRSEARFAADSETAAYLSQVSPMEQPLLSGLRGRDAPLLFGVGWKTAQPRVSFTERLAEALLTAADDGAAEFDQMRAALSVYRRVAGYAGCMETTDGKVGLRYCYYADDPAAVVEPLWKMGSLGPRTMAGVAPGIDMTAESGTEQIGKRECRYVEVRFQSEDEAILDTLTRIYGRAVRSYYYADADGVHMVVAGPDVARGLVERDLAGETPSVTDDPRVRRAIDAISARPQVIAMLDLAGLLAKLATSFPHLGLPAEMKKSPDAPYAVWGLYLEDRRARTELMLPAAAVKALIDVVEQPSSDSAPASE